MKPAKPQRMKRGIGRLKTLYNGLRDFVVARDVNPGIGLVEQETPNGREISVSRELQALANSYRQILAGDPPTDDPSNPWNRFIPDGGGTGTGLPGVDPGENPDDPPSYDGNPLGWKRLSVCLIDEDGNKTPASVWSFTTSPIPD